MSRLRQEFAVAPRAGVVVSAAVALAAVVPWGFVTRGGPVGLRLVGFVGFPLFFFV